MGGLKERIRERKTAADAVDDHESTYNHDTMLNRGGNIVGTNGRFSGTVTAGGYLIPRLVVSEDTTLTVEQVKSYLVIVSGDGTSTITVTLPAVAECDIRSSLTIFVATSNVVSVVPHADDRIMNSDGGESSVGEGYSSVGSPADQITLIIDSVDGWAIVGRGENSWT